MEKMEGKITVTQLDYMRLSRLIKESAGDRNIDPRNLVFLGQEIERAKKVDPKKIAPDFVTMKSEVKVVDLDSGRPMTLKLVYPEKADFKKGLISIFSPLGCAMLGYKVGDEIQFEVPAGKKKVRIEELIYQPEAAGEDLQ